MRILLVHDYGTLHGGAEIMSVALRDALRARGHETRLLSSDVTRLALPLVADDRCPGSTGVARRVLQIANPFAARTLRRVIARFRPDVVHVRMFMTQLSPAILPVLRRVPAVLHVVNHDLVCPLTTRILPDGRRCYHRPGLVCGHTGCVGAAGAVRTVLQQALLRRGLPAIDRVVANSDATRAVLERCGIPVDAVIWNGVPETEVRPALGDPPVALAAGRLVREKGFDVLVRAMAGIRDRIPAARLVVAGDGPARTGLERLVGELGIAGAVEFTGHLSRADLEARAAPAWVQVVPSVWDEPFGIVAAEAMMRGTGVIASDAGGLREIVQQDATGLRVPPGDVEALAGALATVLSDRSRAERYGRAGRDFARAELSEPRMVERFIDLYTELTGAAGARAHG